ncbi:MAG: metallophosphoesterase family protein [bacterium]|nr:metallophosphoesterase family protein [bacterium]
MLFHPIYRAFLSILFAFSVYGFTICPALAHENQSHLHNATPGSAAHDPRPTPVPDRIVLTWKTDPATSQAVTWRTDASVVEATVEIAPADGSPGFVQNAQKIQARTDSLETENGLAHYHSTNLTGLTPATLYAYRVGSGNIWSEWFHFRTASTKAEPFSFIYFGDAQNNLLSLWSRTIRSAYADAPKASFMIHAGDLINRANVDGEWSEWFRAGSWIHATIPGIPTPGNHEYANNKEGVRQISHLWRPQFTLPEMLEGLEELVYYIDYQGTRIISLNSNEKREEQAAWLETVLKNNPNRWTVITFHHPIYSTGKGRDNAALRNLWKPLFDKYRVDLVLQGHDHTYARGQNLPQGANKRDLKSGTMYVVSVSGPKMYYLTPNQWWDRAAENTQLYQIITIHNNTLSYRAVTATGEPYDAFELTKRHNGPNKLKNQIPGTPERRHENTPGGRK